MKKWLHNLLKGMSLTAALFVFQACYGTPAGWTITYNDNGQSIFLPAAGSYWSSSLLSPDDARFAISLSFETGGNAVLGSAERRYGYLIRPVVPCAD